MAVNQDTLYVKGDRNVEVTKREVTLGDLVSMECSNRVILPHLKTMKVLKIPENGEKLYVISILKIIACIHEKYPGLEVQNLGETDLNVTYEMQKTPSKWVHVAKTILVVLITFFGAAFSMMAFNNDVDVDKLFGYIYYWMTGKQSSGFTILEVSYSVGITIGILVFFNHFGKRRFSVDPTPMEVQMRLYENDIQERICNAMDTLPVKAAVPYQSKRIGPDDGTEFLNRYINGGWYAETNNSWFEIAQQVSESLYNLMEVRGTSPEDTARELQNAVKLIIIKKR